MKELDEYFKLQQTIYDNFGYKEAWRIYPLDDQREAWWSIESNVVHWSDKKENHQQLIDQEYECADIPGDDAYSGLMIGWQHDTPKIYESKDKKLSMIIVDTRVDFNVFLMIFDNERKLGH
jgi:hypothetical protein